MKFIVDYNVENKKPFEDAYKEGIRDFEGEQTDVWMVEINSLEELMELEKEASGTLIVERDAFTDHPVLCVHEGHLDG
ncbi:hypothetical protein ACI3ER_11905 [Bacillus sp. Wb]